VAPGTGRVRPVTVTMLRMVGLPLRPKFLAQECVIALQFGKTLQ
jgi:hypothetical protein